MFERGDIMLEMVQFRTRNKQKLKAIAKSRNVSLNTLMIWITDDYLKGIENDEK